MTFEPGEAVRVVGWRGVFRLKALRADGTADVYGGTADRFGWRTADPSRLRRARRGDVVPSWPAAWSKPLARKARR